MAVESGALKDVFAENVRDEPHFLVRLDTDSVTNHDTGRFLTTVL